MADLFKGMSQSNFLDGLVRKFGLNGHELYDYLMSLKVSIPEEVDKNDVRPIKDIGRFYGNNRDALNYIISLGADEKIQQLFKASSPEFRACIMCSVARTHRFEWTAPVHLLTPNMTEKEKIVDKTFIGYWDEEREIYTF